MSKKNIELYQKGMASPRLKPAQVGTNLEGTENRTISKFERVYGKDASDQASKSGGAYGLQKIIAKAMEKDKR
jgi:hypothetical protein